MSHRFNLVALLLTIVLLAGCTSSETRSPDYSLYLVRHAEKSDQPTNDPVLNAAGLDRARALTRYLAAIPLAAVWSSPYARTRQTAAPIARDQGLKIQDYDPRDLSGLSIQLRDLRENALVVGHSNTTPELAALLSGKKVETMPETEYDRLYRIDFFGSEAVLHTLNQKELEQD